MLCMSSLSSLFSDRLREEEILHIILLSCSSPHECLYRYREMHAASSSSYVGFPCKEAHIYSLHFLLSHFPFHFRGEEMSRSKLFLSVFREREREAVLAERRRSLPPPSSSSPPQPAGTHVFMSSTPGSILHPGMILSHEEYNNG